MEDNKYLKNTEVLLNNKSSAEAFDVINQPKNILEFLDFLGLLLEGCFPGEYLLAEEIEEKEECEEERLYNKYGKDAIVKTILPDGMNGAYYFIFDKKNTLLGIEATAY